MVKKEELAELILAGCKEALADERISFTDISERQHFLDHEQFAKCRLTMPIMEANHRFVTEWRENTEAVKKSFFKTLMWVIGTSFALIATYITARIRGWNA